MRHISTTISSISAVGASLRLDTAIHRAALGLTGNDGHENDGPSKLQDMKLQHVKLTDQAAEREIAGHENGGPNYKV